MASLADFVFALNNRAGASDNTPALTTQRRQQQQHQRQRRRQRQQHASPVRRQSLGSLPVYDGRRDQRQRAAPVLPPPAIKAGDDDRDSVGFRNRPLDLRFPEELENLLQTGDNAVITFYREGCAFCKMFEPVYKDLAANIHRTNLQPGAVPIVMAQMDGGVWRDEVRALLPPGALDSFPSIVFKRGADGTLQQWDRTKPRDKVEIMQFMARFFGDRSMTPVSSRVLLRTMRDPNPRFVFFSSDIDVIPRFVPAVDPDFVDRENALHALNYAFIMRPDLAHGGLFVPVNVADRPDIRVPTIYVFGRSGSSDDREWGMRDAARWVAARLRGAEPPEGGGLPSTRIPGTSVASSAYNI
jgi:hypothetical protein